MFGVELSCNGEGIHARTLRSKESTRVVYKSRESLGEDHETIVVKLCVYLLRVNARACVKSAETQMVAYRGISRQVSHGVPPSH